MPPRPPWCTGIIYAAFIRRYQIICSTVFLDGVLRLVQHREPERLGKRTDEFLTKIIKHINRHLKVSVSTLHCLCLRSRHPLVPRRGLEPEALFHETFLPYSYLVSYIAWLHRRAKREPPWGRRFNGRVHEKIRLGWTTVTQVTYVTALFPYVVLLILLVRGVTLNGSLEGILYYITPRWEQLASAQVIQNNRSCSDICLLLKIISVLIL